MAKIIHTNVGTGIETLQEFISEDMHELTEEGELLVSDPPSGFHKVYNIYAKKIDSRYHLVMVIETDPVP